MCEFYNTYVKPSHMAAMCVTLGSHVCNPWQLSDIAAVRPTCKQTFHDKLKLKLGSYENWH